MTNNQDSANVSRRNYLRLRLQQFVSCLLWLPSFLVGVFGIYEVAVSPELRRRDIVRGETSVTVPNSWLVTRASSGYFAQRTDIREPSFLQKFFGQDRVLAGCLSFEHAGLRWLPSSQCRRWDLSDIGVEYSAISELVVLDAGVKARELCLTMTDGSSTCFVILLSKKHVDLALLINEVRRAMDE